MSKQIRRIREPEYLEFLQAANERGGVPLPDTTVSFLQTPAWARVKPEWNSELVGFFEASAMVGVGLVLYRRMPVIKRSLAYLPEGPVLDWTRDDVAEFLDLLTRHVRKQGAFTLRIGPTITGQIWAKDTIKDGIADPGITSLTELPADQTNRFAVRLANQLRHLGWQENLTKAGFAAGQPRFNFQLPLTVVEDGQERPATEAELLAGMNQLWRRNIKKADKAGVVISQGGREDLAAFHELYLETAERDGFTGRPLGYFETMWDALRAEDPDRIRLYLAHHEGDLVAAATWVRVGEHVWYSYGASSNAKREVRGSNAMQWQMIRDALAAGARTYDLRGITPGLGADDPEIGLIQFKVGTGGRAISYIGEWDRAINPLLHKAFNLYLARR